jgi:hypothetical protein
MDTVAQFRRAVEKLVGLAPWGVKMGTAWHFSLDWGGEVVRGPGVGAMPQGEYRLLVSGSWRLDAQDGVVCSWRDFNRAGERGIPSLSGRKVTRIEISPPGHDLVVEFEGNLTLRVFSDRDASFIFFTPEWAFGVDEECRLKMGR